MNKSIKDLRQITSYANDNDINIKRILVPRTALNDVRLWLMKGGHY